MTAVNDWLNTDFNNTYGSTLGLNKFLMGTSSPINPDPDTNYAFKFDAENERDSVGNMLIRNLSANKITAGTLISGVIYGGTIFAAQVGAGTLPVSVIYSGTINANSITAGTISGTTVTVQDLNADNITSGTITGRTFRTGSSGARVQVDAGGAKITIYDSSNNEQLVLDNQTIKFRGRSTRSSDDIALYYYKKDGDYGFKTRMEGGDWAVTQAGW